MVVRSVVGAVAAVAVIGALAAAMPERKGTAVPVAAKEPPFGAVPRTMATGGALDAAIATPTERQALLRLATLSDPRPKVMPAVLEDGVRSTVVGNAAAQVALIPSPLTDVPQEKSSPPVASLSPSIVTRPPDSEPTLASAQAPAPGEAPARPQPDPPKQIATRTPDSGGPSKTKPGLVNINKASVAELDHLPGGGKIGFAISRRRPYRSVDDLVRKRVLRDSIFARIRSSITVD